MEKLNLPFFYQVGHQLSSLASIRVSETPSGTIFLACGALVPTLTELLALPSLKVAKPAGEELQGLIENLRQGMVSEKYGQVDFTKPIDSKNIELQSDMLLIVQRALEFQIVLNAELQSLAVYLVTPTGIYSTTDLVDNAADVIPGNLKAKLPVSAVEEITLSGRCLAFGVGTACGFHIIRATETVMHAYYAKMFKQGKKCEELESWGSYINKFRNSEDVDAKRIAEMLQQVKDHDRNLIMHPEVSLSGDEAHTLFDVAKGAIMAMAEEL